MRSSVTPAATHVAATNAIASVIAPVSGSRNGTDVGGTVEPGVGRGVVTTVGGTVVDVGTDGAVVVVLAAGSVVDVDATGGVHAGTVSDHD